ncbi:tRNA (adenosine(37)-N6)-threonylcarbamoyltransferase complex ATPase subunit type 1 TsaE [Canibacter zhuwentaonis]|uniref:tRNA (adenosine(37)-N6)-threonylcarbamoyltransferase complex ATPase subunit type 1 TsaE n=1 Tax=Canibacter zhuwentaonis TaxID=2837491 RepID=UPI002027FC35|nr:tRNA (adenosine(37)-N6)-threonylcarbamoyltransferase complex ATPase subunit type 1 TsaE [Canibacter zhuwentaonis]
MNTTTWEQMVATPSQMHALGVRLGELLRAGDLILLTGELGAGKTTLTRGIGEGARVLDNISSPTFIIARTHKTVANVDFVHIDAYRLESSAELEDLGIDTASSIIVAEWGAGLVSDDEIALEIVITRSVADMAGAGVDASGVAGTPVAGLAGAARASSEGADGNTSTAGVQGATGSPDAANAETPYFNGEAVFEGAEPRVLQFTARGERWQHLKQQILAAELVGEERDCAE